MGKTEQTKKALQNTKNVGIAGLVEANVMKLGDALPSHMRGERMVRIALTTLRQTPKLMNCDPFSFLGALFQCAQLGLEPNIDGQAYILPYGKEATFQVGFRGWVALFYRHKSAKGLQWGVVHDNDLFDFDKAMNTISHKIDLKADRGEPYAFWVKAFLDNGASSFHVMSKIECEKHGKRHSKTYGNGPWKTDFDSMALKTVLIQLMKILPKSVEIQKATAMDNTIRKFDAERFTGDMLDMPDETDWDESKPVDAEVDLVVEAQAKLDKKRAAHAKSEALKEKLHDQEPVDADPFVNEVLDNYTAYSDLHADTESESIKIQLPDLSGMDRKELEKLNREIMTARIDLDSK